MAFYRHNPIRNRKLLYRRVHCFDFMHNKPILLRGTNVLEEKVQTTKETIAGRSGLA